MKYTIEGFSQQALLALGLDCVDAVILRYIMDFYHSDRMMKIHYEGKEYFWINYKNVIDAIPIIKIKSKDVLRRRCNKYIETGIMEHYTCKEGGTFSYYRFTEKYTTLIEYVPESEEGTTQKSEGTTQKSEGTTQKSEGTTQKSERVRLKSRRGYDSKVGTNNSSIKDNSSIKEKEREKNPALALFNENFPKITLNTTKKEDIITTVTNLEAWKYTIWWWKFKEYRAERTDNILDFYQQKAIPKLQQVTQERQEQEDPRVSDNGDSDTNSNSWKVWNSALKALEKRINRPSFNTWLRPTQLSAIVDHSVQFSVPDDVFVYWLGEYYEEVITEVLSEKLGFRPKISFVVEPEQPKQTEPNRTELF